MHTASTRLPPDNNEMITTPRNSLLSILPGLIHQTRHLPLHLSLWHLTHRVDPRRHQRIRPKPRILTRVVLGGFLLENYVLQTLFLDDLAHALRPGDGTEEGEAEGAHAVQAAVFERRACFGEAEVGVGGPVDFVPLEIASGFCGVDF